MPKLPQPPPNYRNMFANKTAPANNFAPKRPDFTAPTSAPALPTAPAQGMPGAEGPLHGPAQPGMVPPQGMPGAEGPLYGPAQPGVAPSGPTPPASLPEESSQPNMGPTFAEDFGSVTPLPGSNNQTHVLRSVNQQLQRASQGGATKNMDLQAYDQWFRNNPAVAGHQDKFGKELSALYEQMMPSQARRDWQGIQAIRKLKERQAKQEMQDKTKVDAYTGVKTPTTVDEIQMSREGQADRQRAEQMKQAAERQKMLDEQAKADRLAQQSARAAEDKRLGRVGSITPVEGSDKVFEWMTPSSGAFRDPAGQQPKASPAALQSQLDGLMQTYNKAKSGMDEADPEYIRYLEGRIKGVSEALGGLSPFGQAGSRGSAGPMVPSVGAVGGGATGSQTGSKAPSMGARHADAMEFIRQNPNSPLAQRMAKFAKQGE